MTVEYDEGWTMSMWWMIAQDASCSGCQSQDADLIWLRLWMVWLLKIQTVKIPNTSKGSRCFETRRMRWWPILMNGTGGFQDLVNDDELDKTTRWLKVMQGVKIRNGQDAMISDTLLVHCWWWIDYLRLWLTTYDYEWCDYSWPQYAQDLKTPIMLILIHY